MDKGLTKAQWETLEACRDWSAAHEIAERRRAAGTIVFASRARVTLGSLCARGLVEYHPANRTYRATDGGLAALQAQEPRNGQ